MLKSVRSLYEPSLLNKYVLHGLVALSVGDKIIKLGFHMSVAGALANAPRATVEKGYSALQIFASSPRMWRNALYKEEERVA